MAETVHMPATTPTLLKSRIDTNIRQKSPSDLISNVEVADIIADLLDTCSAAFRLSATADGLTTTFNFPYNGPATCALVTAASADAVGHFMATVTPPVPNGAPGYLSIQYTQPPQAATGGATGNLNWVCALFSVSGTIAGTNTSTPGTLPANMPPVVSAGPNQNVLGPVAGVNLNGTATDTDGAIVLLQWSQVSGPASGVFSNPSQLATSFSTPQLGVYVLRLTAFDDLGVSAHSDVIINVYTGVQQ